MNSQSTTVRQVAVGSAEKTQPGTMLMRSTGLGKTELHAKIVGLKRQGDYLIMEVQTTSPVHWKIRSGLSRRDFRQLLRALLTVEVLSYLLNIKAWFKDPAHPGDF